MTSQRLPVTVVIPTLNEEDRLPACLRSVAWAEQVIVADGGSTDETAALARAAGADLIAVPNATIGEQRNAALAQARCAWVLALDADERATPELQASIAAAIAAPVADVYRVHMRNQYLGAPVERGSWGRDRHPRFFRSSLRFTVKRVHERLDHTGPVGDLGGRVDHDSYRDVTHHLRKIQTYARWGADDLYERGRRASLADLLVRPVWRFLRSYIFEGSWRDGRRGLVFASMHTWATFAKYALLWDRERTERASVGNGASPRPRDDTDATVTSECPVSVA